MAPKKSKYDKVDPRKHVLKRPNMYIGSIEPDTYNTWVYNEGQNSMEKRNIKYVPGLYKIYDEILINAVDHYVRMREEKRSGKRVNLVKNIKIEIDRESGVIAVENDGDGIEIEKHPEHNVWNPELIFGHMLTSSNFDDNEEKIIGGQNGIGAKACNIFSEWFQVTTVDKKRKQRYTQKFSDNMSKLSEPVIESCGAGSYTRIDFLPDYELLRSERLDEDMFQIMKKRAYDSCAVTGDDVLIYFNGEKLEYKNFKRYVDLYLGDERQHTRVHELINESWEVVASYNESGGFDQVSFVNGIWTIRGGKHVDHIVNQITKKLIETIGKKKKNLVIKPQTIRDNLIVFVKATVINPTFDSQSKETLTTPVSKFGERVQVSENFIKKLSKTGIVDRVLEINQVFDNKSLQKTDGKKRVSVRGLPKLDDANWAGGLKSSQCTLILTEGDSASTMAITGIGALKNGRDIYGVFPLKGKLMNVLDAAVSKVGSNEEINNLKKILGLESGKKYVSTDMLRYGKVMAMTDQDHDGSHIKGLLFNLFWALWPELIKINTFVTSMNTPIVKVFYGNQIVAFYNQQDYDLWCESNQNVKHTSKYYKGLGTSSDAEAEEYFRNLKQVKYMYDGEIDDKSINLAFNKKQADDRKLWLGNYDRNNTLNYNSDQLSYSDFINKELIHFSTYDVARSIPSLCDGLKVSQRKILWSCFKRNLTNEIKVAQLSGYVSEKAAYHHGEASLQGAIIGMAQDYVGSNNINLLEPRGQFGSRRQGGRDSASPRYIFTCLSPITRTIFPKDDDNVLEYLEDDGESIEPECYYPIIPMILINGGIGIGTGFSTTVSCYKPEEVIDTMKKFIENQGEHFTEEEHPLAPWYKGFDGIIELKDGKWVSRGKYEKIAPNKIRITELPIGHWTVDFREHIEQLIEKNGSEIKNYESQSKPTTINEIITFSSAETCSSYLETEKNGYTKMDNQFKLVTSKNLGTTNMYLFDHKKQITKYQTIFDIFQAFYRIRYDVYQRRKKNVILTRKSNLEILENKLRFIRGVVAGEITVFKMKRSELSEELERNKFVKVENTYDYLLKIPIFNLTTDMIEKLQSELVETQDSLREYEMLSIESIWIKELDLLKSVLIENKQSRSGKSASAKKRR